MTAKPTPGPYTIDGKRPDIVRVRGAVGEIVAAFPLGPGIDREQAEANARAWVEGMAALDRLARIERWIKADAFDGEKLVRIRDILDEAKP